MANKTNKSKTSQKSLTPEELNMSLNYFDAFSRSYGNGYGILRNNWNYWYNTPQTINAGLQGINMNPNIPTSENITKALDSPKTSEEILRNYATYFELHSHLYKRILSYDSDLLAWNLTFDCYNATKEDFNSIEFKQDLAIIDDFCSRFNLKDFRKIVYQILRQGVYFGVFRDEASIYSWQQLPSDRCLITGDSNVGKLFDFDFSYFLNTTGTNIDMYPPIFKRLYAKVIRQSGDMYKPQGKIDKRHSSFIYWINVSPKDNFFCFDMNNALMTMLPYYSSLFEDMDLQPLMRSLEKNKAMISAQKLLVGIIDTYETAKSGTVPNQLKVTPEVMGKFLSLARQALDESIGLTAMPVKDVKAVDFSVEAQNRYTAYQRNLSANALSSSASILTENKLNTFESQLALTIDENFVKGLYSQFENFLNYYINKRTAKYKFKFTFNDTNTNRDQKLRIDNFKNFAQMGIVDINLYARATNQTVFQAQRALQFTKSLGLENELISLMSLNNQTASGEAGRPVAEDSVSDGTEASRATGSNEGKVR